MHGDPSPVAKSRVIGRQIVPNSYNLCEMNWRKGMCSRCGSTLLHRVEDKATLAHEGKVIVYQMCNRCLFRLKVDEADAE